MMAEWQLAHSRLRIGAFVVIVAAVLLALYHIELKGLWQWLVAALVALFVYDSARCWCDGVRSFALRQGQWWLSIGAEPVAVQLEGFHFAGPRLGVLRFRSAVGTRYVVTILPDMLSGEDSRKLVLALR